MVSLILNGQSSGLDAENLIREVAKIIFGRKASAQRKMTTLLEQRNKLQLELGILESRIKELQNKLKLFPASSLKLAVGT